MCVYTGYVHVVVVCIWVRSHLCALSSEALGHVFYIQSVANHGGYACVSVPSDTNWAPTGIVVVAARADTTPKAETCN